MKETAALVQAFSYTALDATKLLTNVFLLLFIAGNIFVNVSLWTSWEVNMDKKLTIIGKKFDLKYAPIPYSEEIIEKSLTKHLLELT